MSLVDGMHAVNALDIELDANPNYIKTVGGELIEQPTLVLSKLWISTTEEIGSQMNPQTPIQLQFEITGLQAVSLETSKSGACQYRYVGKIVSAKARVKPSTPAFVEGEEQALNNIIDGTDEKDDVQFREAKIAQKEPNRFTGLEIS